MDKLLYGLAIAVLIVVIFMFPQYKMCGMVVATALALGGYLLARCEYGAVFENGGVENQSDSPKNQLELPLSAYVEGNFVSSL